MTRLNPDGDHAVRWWGRTGRTYFLQISEDLVTWTYFPEVVKAGHDGVIFLYLSLSGFDRLFLRLKYPFPDIATVDPATDDFDGDKVSNLIEIDLGTDPLHSADSDGDGMSDDWETRFGLLPDASGDAALDPDSDGTSNLAEYQSGPLGSDPTDCYNGVLPTVQTLSGHEQTGEPGSFSPDPLVLELKFGATPVNNGPVTVSTDGAGSGQISLTHDGAGSSAGDRERFCAGAGARLRGQRTEVVARESRGCARAICRAAAHRPNLSF